MSKPTTYWDYIRVESLLGLQKGIAASEGDLSNDEVMFITIHQIDELWFKLLLRELVTVRDLFAQPHVPEQSLASGVRGLRRMAKLLAHIAHHFSLMETMTTRDYLGFRDKLTSASGFQSFQLREIEVLLGLQDADRIPLGHEGSYLVALLNPDGSPSVASRRVEARLADKPSLAEAIREWLYRTPICGSLPDSPNDAAAVERFISVYLAAHERSTRAALANARKEALTEADRTRLGHRYEAEIAGSATFLRAMELPNEAERQRASRVRAALVFLEGYRELPLLAWPREVVDAIVALEESFVIFRQRHARMVERIIGRRTGTGGSAGVEYLDQTALKYRIFREVWAVRTILVRKDEFPSLEEADYYGFAEAPRSMARLIDDEGD